MMVFQATILHCKAVLGWGATWANEINFGMNHAPVAGSIAQPVDQQSSALPLCYDPPPFPPAPTGAYEGAMGTL